MSPSADRTYRALFVFAGIGGGALGFLRAREELRGLRGRFSVAGAVDFDAAAARTFKHLTGHPCTVGDLAEMSPEDLRAACDGPPDIVFTSPPCKSFSGCLPAATAKTPRYREMSQLAVRGLWLTLEAWPDHPPGLILMENVPRIQNRGRWLLDQVQGMLRSYGYATRESVYDCGELGGLGQRRRRFLLVARHTAKVPPFWHQPPAKPLRSIGDVIGVLPVPLPGSAAGGPMHALPRLSAMNWLRLALIPAGGDWRDLPERVEVGARPGRQNGGYGVNGWDEPGHTVVAEGSVQNTWGSVSDPRLSHKPNRHLSQQRVEGWGDQAHTVTGADRTGSGALTIADPRMAWENRKGVFRVQPGDAPASTVIGASRAYQGHTVADPRVTCVRREGGHGVTPWDQPGTTVIGSPIIDNGPWQVADPRVECGPRAGAYGVLDWDGPSGTIIGSAKVDNSGACVADPRLEWHAAPAAFDLDDRRPLASADTPIIIAADGTWHRPMTTLELAALQGFPVVHRGGWLDLDGSKSVQRQHIGNAVPPPAAEAIAEAALRALLSAELGIEELSCTGWWVDPSRAVAP